MPLLFLSKSNPLRWTSVWFLGADMEKTALIGKKAITAMLQANCENAESLTGMAPVFSPRYDGIFGFSLLASTMFTADRSPLTFRPFESRLIVENWDSFPFGAQKNASAWSEQAREKKAACEAGTISLEEFTAWLKNS